MFKPMLAQEMQVGKRFASLLIDDNYRLQQKADGMRVVFTTGPDQFKAHGRHGNPFTKTVSPQIREALRKFGAVGVFVFDGELVDTPRGQRYMIFDVVRIEDLDGRIVLDETDAYGVRRMQLEIIARSMPAWFMGPVKLMAEACTEQDKLALFEVILNNGGEGVILRDVRRPYVQGPKRELIKVKFTKTIDVVVTACGLDGHDNCEYGAYEKPRSRKLTRVGRCSLYGKAPVKVGDVIEVRYLYATHDDDGSIHLFQPRMLRVRDDKRARECLVDQIHFVNREIL